MVKKTLRWEVPALPSLRSLHPEFVAFRITFSLQSTSLYRLSYNAAFSKNPEKAPPTVRDMNGSFKKNLSKHRLLSLRTVETKMTMKPRMGRLPRWQHDCVWRGTTNGRGSCSWNRADCQPRRQEKISYFGEHSACLHKSSSLPFLPASKAVSGLSSVYVIKQWLVKFNLSLLTSQ